MLHTLVRFIFALIMLARSIKTCLVVNANHLEIFLMQFGTKLVFKLLANYAFKSTLENSQKPFIFSFYIPIQNLCRIFSWSLKQSCRGLNSKQLLFEIYLKIKFGK
jgi:hypothetical protein